MQTEHKYTDYSITSGLLSRRGKREFVSWADTELEITLEDTPENRVWALSQIMDRDAIEPSYVLSLESDLIPVLARMETI